MLKSVDQKLHPVANAAYKYLKSVTYAMAGRCDPAGVQP